jgi:hypothetical protein
LLLLTQLLYIFGPSMKAYIRVSPDDPSGRTGGVQQNTIERLSIPPDIHLGGIGMNDLG